MNKTGSKNIIMKLGSKDFIVYGNKTGEIINRQYFSALNSNPLDETGAGDSPLTALSEAISGLLKRLK